MSNGSPTTSLQYDQGIPRRALDDWTCSKCGSLNDGNRLKCKIFDCNAKLPPYASDRIREYHATGKGDLGPTQRGTRAGQRHNTRGNGQGNYSQTPKGNGKGPTQQTRAGPGQRRGGTNNPKGNGKGHDNRPAPNSTESEAYNKLAQAHQRLVQENEQLRNATPGEQPTEPATDAADDELQQQISQAQQIVDAMQNAKHDDLGIYQAKLKALRDKQHAGWDPPRQTLLATNRANSAEELAGKKERAHKQAEEALA